jgi:hypothetical protein
MRAKVIILKHQQSDKGHKMAIRLSKGKQKKYRSLDVYVQPINWDFINDRLKSVMPVSVDHPNYEKYQEYKKTKTFLDEKLKKYEQKIEDLARGGRPFTFDRVINEVENPPQEATTVFQVIEMMAGRMDKEERYSNASIYRETKARISEFTYGRDLMFYEMDDNFLLDLRRHYTKKGNSAATISKILRTIRASFNEAIRRGIARQDDYPFKKNRNIMVGLSSHSYKSRSLSKFYIDALRELDSDKVPQGSDLWHARNYFIVGYLGNGINLADIARLRWEPSEKYWSEGYILDGRIYYVRQKTKRSVKTLKSFAINQELKLIIDYYRWHWRRSKQLGNPYIFPIFNGFHAEDEKRKYNRINRSVKEVNSSLKELGKMIKAPFELTTYVWRHSRARVMVDNGASPMEIQQTLGHQTILTTQHYLKQFDNKEIDKHQSYL